MSGVGLWTQQWSLQKQIPVEYFPTVDSTSSYAKTLMADPLESHHKLHLVVAENQNSGRGRGLNSWVNPKSGTSLLSTWSFRVTRPPQPIMSARVGLALFQAITKVWPEAPFSLKAPNDLYLSDKKVAGILLEVVDQGPHIRLLIGLGLNVMDSPQLNTATHLQNHMDLNLIEKNWTSFLDELYHEFQTACDQLAHHLSEFDSKRLMIALNANPNLKSQYTKVDVDGSLWQGEKKTHWSEL